MSLAAGTRLGPYEVLEPIGAGGMGEVYKARDTRLERSVAIKVLPQHLSADPDLRTRFEREARAVSSLNHPHICTLHDVGHQDGVDYLVMEHLEGESLAARLQRGPLPAAEVLRYAVEIADALDRAHRQGLIHRDLKPGNVMLTKSGAKLLDFGLARAMAAPGAGGSGLARAVGMLSHTPTMSTPLTAAGMIVGTFQYMAPEQLDGGEADARSDVWAFGATVYEMATGKKAFEGHSQASLIASILKEEPRPIAELQPLTPPGLDRIVQRCLAKDPDDRWQSARDMAHELQWIAKAGSKAGVPAPIAARRRVRERVVTAVAAASSVAAVALGAVLVLRRPPEPSVMRFDIRPPSAVQFQDAPRVSPDGRYLAYSATDSTGTSRIWLRALAATTAQPMPGTEGIVQRPFWSPDSRYLGFFATGKLKKVAVSGGPVVTIADVPSGSDGSWSRDGVILYDGGTNDPIRRVSASGGIPAIAVAGDSAKHELVGWPYFLPDGKHFLFIEINGHTLNVGTLGSQKTRSLGPCDTRVEYTPPGYLVFARGGSLVAQRFDAGGLKFKGEPFPIAEAVRTQATGGADFSCSENGVLIYAAGSSQSSRLVWMDRSGRELGTVENGNLENMLNPDLAPNGRRIALRVQDPQTRTRDLWLIDLTRGVPSRFTFDPRNENHPLWSPDGNEILYWSDAPGGEGLYVKSASGAGEARQVAKGQDEMVGTDWSRDGRQVFYSVASGGKNQIWVLPMTGDRTPTRFLAGAFNFDQGRLSPDGRWLAYVSDESGRPEVYVQTFPEHAGKWQISSTGGVDPRWSRDGHELFFLAADQRLMSVSVRTTPSFEAAVPKSMFLARVLFPGVGIRSYYAVGAQDQGFLVVGPRIGDALAGSSVIVNWTAEVGRR
jgi:Tol biopolymer transport system component